MLVCINGTGRESAASQQGACGEWAGGDGERIRRGGEAAQLGYSKQVWASWVILGVELAIWALAVPCDSPREVKALFLESTTVGHEGMRCYSKCHTAYWGEWGFACSSVGPHLEKWRRFPADPRGWAHPELIRIEGWVLRPLAYLCGRRGRESGVSGEKRCCGSVQT
jgi:hypothetical protein